MNLIPITRFRSTRVSDGAGGFTETMDSALECYGVVSLANNQEVVIVNRHEVIRPEDVIRIKDEMDQNDAWYRVGSIMQPAGSEWRQLTIMKIDRPLWPLDLQYLFYDGHQLFFNGSPIYVV